MESVSSISNRLFAQGRFRHIQVLLKLAELGNIKRTGEAIGMTQSAVTQTLAYIEKMAGAPLFTRHARGISPTQVGTDLLPVVRHLMQGIEDGAELLHARQSANLGSVRLMASASGISGLLLPLLPTFHELNPRIQVQLREGESDDLLLAMSRKDVDLVVCRRPSNAPSGWVFTAVQSDKLAVIAGPRHRLSGQGPVDWADLAQERWVLPPVNSLARTRLDELAGAHGIELKAYPLITRSVAMLQMLMVREGLIALLPLSVVRHAVALGELAEIQLGDAHLISPIGVMCPVEGMGVAATVLADFFKFHHPPAEDVFAD